MGLSSTNSMGLPANVAIVGALGLGVLYAIKRFDLFSVFSGGGDGAVDFGSQVANGIGESGQGVIDFGSDVANGIGESGQGVLDFFGNLGSGLTDFFNSLIPDDTMNAGSSGGGSLGGGVTDYFTGFQDQLNNLVQGALDTFDNNNNNNNNVVKENPYATNTIGYLPSGEAIYSGFKPLDNIYTPTQNNKDNMQMNNDNILDNIGGALTGAGDFVNDALTGAGNYIQGGFDSIFNNDNNNNNDPDPTPRLDTGEPIYPGFAPL